MENKVYKDHLETGRLIARFLTTEDALPWEDFFKEKDAVEFLPTFGLTTAKERSIHWINRQINRYKTNQFGLQALINKTTDAFIGQCGLIMQEVDGKPEIEVGYHIFKQYWGQGFAPEAAKVFIDFAFNNRLTDSVISIIDIRNVKSQKVADKNGLQKEKQTKWNDVDVFIYRITKNNLCDTYSFL